MADIKRTEFLSQFTCLGDKCADTCCKGWSMQLDKSMYEKYQKEAPELLDAVEPSHESPWIMRKDKKTGYCVKFDNGWCGIHKEKGESFLGDACFFYPRATRALGDQVVMTAALSCPEVTRLVLEREDPFALEDAVSERLPFSLKHYLPEELAAKDALAIHQAFMEATKDEAVPAEHIFARIASASRSLELIDKKTWPQAAPFYLKNAHMRLPEPVGDTADPFNLLHALSGLIVASHKPMPDRLRKTVECMENMLAVKLDWEKVEITTTKGSLVAYHSCVAAWKKSGTLYNAILKRWLAAELSLSLYPFAGLGEKLSDRSTIIGVRMATVKLALMCAHAKKGAALPMDDIIRIIQSLARFLDHLADPTFSLRIYQEAGWANEARLRGLLAL